MRLNGAKEQQQQKQWVEREREKGLIQINCIEPRAKLFITHGSL